MGGWCHLAHLAFKNSPSHLTSSTPVAGVPPAALSAAARM